MPDTEELNPQALRNLELERSLEEAIAFGRGLAQSLLDFMESCDLQEGLDMLRELKQEMQESDAESLCDPSPGGLERERNRPPAPASGTDEAVIVSIGWAVKDALSPNKPMTADVREKAARAILPLIAAREEAACLAFGERVRGEFLYGGVELDAVLEKLRLLPLAALYSQWKGSCDEAHR